jgi:integration host factor subunit alpha
MTLRKLDLVKELVARIGLSRREAREMVDGVFEELSKALEKGKRTRLAGFGSFKVIAKAERPGRNPKTGLGTVISVRRVVSFWASHALRDRVCQHSIWQSISPVGAMTGAEGGHPPQTRKSDFR